MKENSFDSGKVKIFTEGGKDYEDGIMIGFKNTDSSEKYVINENISEYFDENIREIDQKFEKIYTKLEEDEELNKIKTNFKKYDKKYSELEFKYLKELELDYSDESVRKFIISHIPSDVSKMINKNELDKIIHEVCIVAILLINRRWDYLWDIYKYSKDYDVFDM